jgi:hypothetical protein
MYIHTSAPAFASLVLLQSLSLLLPSPLLLLLLLFLPLFAMAKVDLVTRDSASLLTVTDLEVRHLGDGGMCMMPKAL